jgi:hypothetical protein
MPDERRITMSVYEKFRSWNTGRMRYGQPLARSTRNEEKDISEMS